MTWFEIKLELGKKLGDPSGAIFGGVLKNYFRAAYNEYVPTAPLEQLYLSQATVEVTLSDGLEGQYIIPKSCLFINISAPAYADDAIRKRFIQVSDSDYALSASNSIMKPSSSEVKWFKDSNIVRILSDNAIIAFRLNYLPALDFLAIDNNISDDAIAVIMDMVIQKLIPTKVSKDEYPDNNK
jgi:hypothetical protein